MGSSPKSKEAGNEGPLEAQGMNKVELEANPQLTDFIVQNLNTNQILPYQDEEFDLCTIAVSIQYLECPRARIYSRDCYIPRPRRWVGHL